MVTISQINLYYLSTIAQSMATLFAVAGVFAIYQLQRVENRIEHACNSFRLYMANSTSLLTRHSEASEWLNKDIKDHLLFYFKKSKDKNPNDLLPAFVDYFCQIESQENFKDFILKYLWLPMSFIVLTFLLSLYLLFQSNVGSELTNYFLLFSILLTLAFSVWYVFITLIGPQDIVINNPITSDNNKLNALREDYLQRKGDFILKQYDIRRIELTKKIQKLKE